MTHSILQRLRDLSTSPASVKLCVLILLGAATALIAHASTRQTSRGQGTGTPIAPIVHNLAPRIEAVFVLDTTGSMAGLLEGAKRKIWSIANRMASAQSAPDIRLGLIGYRDRGDRYVTRHFQLSSDIDALYGELQQFRAEGGGDTPESVNRALHEAVTGMGWSDDPGVYRVIFLVGDAPPHTDYDNEIGYADSVALANAGGIIVNTVQCGTDPATARVWQKIAQLSQGTYASIAQNGAMRASTTPMDNALARLNLELNETALAYGDPDQRRELLRKMSRAERSAPASRAARLAYLDKRGWALNSGRADLVAAMEAGEVDLESLPIESLPEPMREMNAEQQRDHVETRSKRRAEIQKSISKLVRERDDFLAQERAKRKAEGKADAFDEKVFETIRTQAAKSGIVY